MEMYKSINRALSVQNQGLRQQVAMLKEEIVYLNRTLMKAREDNEVLRRTVLRCVSEASGALSQIIQEINPIECNRQLGKEVPVVEPQLDSSFTSGRSSERSVLPVAPTVRQSHERSDCDKENTNPSLLEDEESVERISYVQMRRRCPPPDVSTMSTMAEQQQSISSQSTIGGKSCVVDDDTANESENDEQTNDESEDSEKSQNNSLNRDIPTIIEEETIIDSYHSNLLSLPTITRTHVNSRTRDQSSVTIEDTTTFDNFSALKATSSTPYKQKKDYTSDAYMRSVRVVIPKLKKSDLELLTSSSVHSSSKHSKINVTRSQDKQNKSVRKGRSATPRHNEKSDTIVNSSSRILTERSTNISNETIGRPKRNAAPTSFKEPSLIKKLRRKT